MTVLAKELATFEKHRQEWCVEHQGKYAVIQDENVLPQFFTEWEDAFKQAIKTFGAGRPVLIRQIWIVDPVYWIYGL
jgi:hypothetical protein